MCTDVKHTILVTGFGPFDMHTVNASWEAVKELQKLCKDLEELHNVKFIMQEIPVSYDFVSSHVRKLWRDYNPAITIHVGVSHKAKCLTIEEHAHNSGYDRPDIHQKCPNEIDTEPHVLKTDIDVQKLCDHINRNSDENGCKACISRDAGRYLCEYIFYQSLRIKSQRTLFIHVPDLNRYTREQTAKGLYDIISYLIKDLKCQRQ